MTKIEGTKIEIENLQNLGGSEKWHSLKAQLEVAYRDEEDYWARNSRVEWLKEWDSNTQFYHAATAQKRVKNRLDRLENQHGDICEGEHAVTEIVSEYFQHLFTTANSTGVEYALDGIQKRITYSMNVQLTKSIWRPRNLHSPIFHVFPQSTRLWWYDT